MGQPIQVESSVIGDVAIFDTDRSITGQDGLSFASAEGANPEEGFPADLASRLFALDDAVNHVFLASNLVVVRRVGGWEDETVGSAAEVVSDFFLVYPEDKEAAASG